jgi:uncharacterized protein with PIN domain
MLTAHIYFHAELNDFFHREYSLEPVDVDFNGHETVKHVIEALGVPHTEVGVILVNGESVGFAHKPRHGDCIHVYPTLEGVNGSRIKWLKPDPLKEIRFILDGHLGKLATYLRLLGFDTRYQNDYADDELAEISSTDDRILLTRDRGLLKRSKVTYGYYVREKQPQKQLVEVVNRFRLSRKAQPFNRCANCNGLLKPIEKVKILDRLQPKTKLYYQEFKICEECQQIYWKGSHFQKMERFINDVISDRNPIQPE